MDVKMPRHIARFSCHAFQGVDDCSKNRALAQILIIRLKPILFLLFPDFKVGAIDTELSYKHGLYIRKLPYSKYTQFPAITTLLDTAKRQPGV
jgi:hypothetical protein